MITDFFFFLLIMKRKFKIKKNEKTKYLKVISYTSKSIDRSKLFYVESFLQDQSVTKLL